MCHESTIEVFKLKNPLSFYIRIIHECAKIAEEKGYKGYGIIFYGECWGYSEPLKTIQRGGCINTEFKECTQDDTICVGDENSAFIYMFDDKVSKEFT